MKSISFFLCLTLVCHNLFAQSHFEKATFGGGCFWCLEPPFDKLPGVISTTSGYSGGQISRPTYQQVSSGKTKYVEVVQVLYDKRKVSYQTLLTVFWKQIDPTDKEGQFVDKGPHYRSVIYYHNEKQKKAALKSKKELIKSQRFKRPIVTTIETLKNFFPAEAYHQDFYKKNPTHYKIYRSRSGRDDFIKKHWKQ